MEKSTPHYPLEAIQKQMKAVSGLHMTKTALLGLLQAKMSRQDAAHSICRLTKFLQKHDLPFKPYVLARRLSQIASHNVFVYQISATY